MGWLWAILADFDYQADLLDAIKGAGAGAMFDSMSGAEPGRKGNTPGSFIINGLPLRRLPASTKA